MDIATVIALACGALAVWLARRVERRALPAPPSAAQDPSRVGPAQAHLRAAGEALGLEVRPHGVGLELVGPLEGPLFQVRPLGLLYADGAMDLEVLAVVPASVGPRWTLRPTRPVTAADPRQVTLGDPVFEQRYTVWGPEAEVRARLDPAARARLLALEGTLTLQAGRISYLTRALFEGPEAIVGAVREVQSVLSDLSVFSVPQGLAAVVDSEDLPAVRRAALVRLLEDFPDEDAEATCRAALGSADPALRVVAAGGLGSAGTATLLEVAAETALTPALRAEAIERLAAPDATAGDALVPLLDDAAVAVAGAAADALARGRVEAGFDALRGRLDAAPSAHAARFVDALVAYDDPAAAPALLALVDSPHPAVAIAAARATGVLGSPDDIPHLRAVLETARGLARRDALTGAVGAIQSRYQGEAGRLSFGDGDAGALALAPGPTGGLALTPEAPETGSD